MSARLDLPHFPRSPKYNVIVPKPLPFSVTVEIRVTCPHFLRSSKYDVLEAEVYPHMQQPGPSTARTFVGVPKLLFGARFEVNGIAISQNRKREK